MTREEQIEKEWVKFAVQSNHRYDEKTFKEAIKWVDNRPRKGLVDINKTREWVKMLLLVHLEKVWQTVLRMNLLKQWRISYGSRYYKN